jgi:hypothetical protein
MVSLSNAEKGVLIAQNALLRNLQKLNPPGINDIKPLKYYNLLKILVFL